MLTVAHLGARFDQRTARASGAPGVSDPCDAHMPELPVLFLVGR